METQREHPPADPRIYLAVERTFLAWIRTALAFLALGFVIARFGVFLRQLAFSSQPAPASNPSPGLSLVIGLGLIAMGAAISLLASVKFKTYVKAIDEGCFRAAFKPDLSHFIVAGLIGFSIALAVILLSI